MNPSSFDIPVHYIRQFLFCPRIPFLLEVVGAKFSSPLWVHQGDCHHRQQDLLMKRRSLQRFGLEDAELLSGVELHSTELGLHGIADAVLLGKDRVFPLEYKLHRHRRQRSHILQLLAYGILVEAKFQKPCDTGFLLYEKDGKTQPVSIDGQRRQELQLVLEQLRQSLCGTLPDSSASAAQCAQCEFLLYCNDRE